MGIVTGVVTKYGAWINYGIGSDNRNLPGYIAMCPGLPVADTSNWRSA